MGQGTGLDYSSSDMRSTANTFRTLNTNLNSTLTEIRTQIESLNSTWDSETAHTIYAKISGMQKHFDDYFDVINKYATYLDRVADDFDTHENSHESNAAAFQ